MVIQGIGYDRDNRPTGCMNSYESEDSDVENVKQATVFGQKLLLRFLTINTLWAWWHEPCWTELILQPFRHFSYITAHSPTLPSLYLCHSSFSNVSIASPTSQLILQPFFCFSYITGSSLTSPGELPMLQYFNIGEKELYGSSWLIYTKSNFMIQTSFVNQFLWKNHNFFHLNPSLLHCN